MLELLVFDASSLFAEENVKNRLSATKASVHSIDVFFIWHQKMYDVSSKYFQIYDISGKKILIQREEFSSIEQVRNISKKSIL